MANKKDHFINPKYQFYLPFDLIQHEPRHNKVDPISAPWELDMLPWLEKNVGNLQYSAANDSYIETYNKYKSK